MFKHADFYTLQKWLTGDEGIELKPYRDPKGILTVMVGVNLEVGFTTEECATVLKMRLNNIFDEITLKLPWVFGLSLNRQLAIINMAYNLGVAGLLEFSDALEALKKENFLAASKFVLNSDAARKERNRYNRIAHTILTDEILSGWLDPRLPEL